MHLAIRMLLEAARQKEKAAHSVTAAAAGKETIQRLLHEAEDLRAAIAILQKSIHENNQSNSN